MRLPSAAEVLVGSSGSLFETWRTKIHVLPPAGRIGDPCAHYNDPKTGWFHVQYLYNGTGIVGVQTDDLVYYYDIDENGNYTSVAGGANDPLAVFDGSVIPRGIADKPTLLYTSVSHLPIHWALPYTRGSESQSLTVTYDGGHNFTKLDRPPVIPEPSEGLDATAFRDPYVFQNKDLDDTVGTRVFLYNVNGETFITLGVEGSYVPITESVTSMHGMLWASGNISKPDGGNVTFVPTMAGVLDWGTSSYAAAGKVLPATSQASEKSGAPDRFISYVWLTGDVFGGVTGFPSEQQGWQNTLLLSAPP
ncbi:glycosyl hydrolase [Aspergillus parasiticus]|uniref:Glycosyl hydrolase n=1 Tax=Aspergillus parasiticus TaxID=5067 RepID=A0A5N6D5J3_ASPPA|nr:glycosyl hydrolase [Aspergillus parasiticus]